MNFDVRTDSKGKDPDSSSETLKHFHKLLWSKNLPNGKLFNLDDTKPNAYLYHKSELGEYYLASDSIIHTYFKWKRTQHIIKQISKNEMKYFFDLSYTIGGFIIFPSNKINGLPTINQERGFNTKINDRIDLTLECIRRYYNNENSPMIDTLKRYTDFFKLFSDFKGFCEYFLLNDLVTNNYSKVNFLLPFKDFVNNPLPKDLNEYNKYKKYTIDFLQRRNKRIEEYSKELR
ncbi:DUF6994 family protein [Nanoarchaeota archaeon]